MAKKQIAYIDAPVKYKPGSQPPVGYMPWHAWAEVQHKAGLRQKRCRVCGLWRYPQEKCCPPPNERDGDG